MILDRLEHADRYAAVHPGLAAGFAFLRRSALAAIGPGRHELDGARLAAIVAHDRGRGQANSPLESHRRYIDIQYVVEGCDLIGWRSTSLCHATTRPYDPTADIAFYGDQPETWLALPAGTFAVFFPNDAHAPLAGAGEVHKVVVKVAVEW